MAYSILEYAFEADITIDPPRHLMVKDSGGTYYTAAATNGDDVKVYSSTDGVSWTLDFTYTASVNEVVKDIKVVLDASDNVNVFVAYDDAGTAELHQITNTTGSFVHHDISGIGFNAATVATDFIGTVWGAEDVVASYLTFAVYDSANNDIRCIGLDVTGASATLIYDEPALNSDSGSISLQSGFSLNAKGGGNDRNDIQIIYNVGGDLRIVQKIGVGTWSNYGSFTFDYDNANRTNITITDFYQITDGEKYLSIHFYDSATSQHYVEILAVDDTFGAPTLTRHGLVELAADPNGGYPVTQIPTAGMLTSIKGTATTDEDRLVYATKAYHNADSPGLVHVVWSSGGSSPSAHGIWPEETTVYDLYGDFWATEYRSPHILTATEWPQDEADGSRSSSFTLRFMIIRVTGGATDRLEAHSIVIPAAFFASVDVTYPTYTVESDNLNIEGTASATYPNYTMRDYQITNHVADFDESFPAYIATGTGYSSSTTDDTTIRYERYTVSVSTSQTYGGATNNFETRYPVYTAIASGRPAIIGTGVATYPSYTASSNHYWGTASSTYGSYEASVSTPASDGSGTATTSVSYRVYTVSTTTIFGIVGSTDSSYTVYRRYTLTGTGIADLTTTVTGTYPSYSALATGITGGTGTGTITYPTPAIAYDSNNIEVDASYRIVASGMITQITGIVSATYPRMHVDSLGQPDSLEKYTGRLVTSDGEAFLDANGNFIILYPSRPAEYEVMFSSMNLQKKAVTEYHSYDFNSIGRNGDGTIYAANYDGIYIVGEDKDDDGSDITANIEKVQIDYDDGMRKRATDAYVYLTCDGTYEFSSMADMGRSDQTIADTDTLPHTRKIDLAKGLIGRALGWGFRSEGTDFSIEEVELIIDSGSRRAKRYVSS